MEEGGISPCPETGAPAAHRHGKREQPLSSSDCQLTLLTWDGDDRARVIEQLKDLSKWPDHLSAYPGLQGVSTRISLISTASMGRTPSLGLRGGTQPPPHDEGLLYHR